MRIFVYLCVFYDSLARKLYLLVRTKFVKLREVIFNDTHNRNVERSERYNREIYIA